jgi:hypothetical protein
VVFLKTPPPNPWHISSLKLDMLYREQFNDLVVINLHTVAEHHWENKTPAIQQSKTVLLRNDLIRPKDTD